MLLLRLRMQMRRYISMAAQDRDVLINELKLEAIANALREKTGVSTNTYTMSQVPGAIDALSLTSSGGSATTAAVAANVLAGKSYINASTGASETGTMTDKSGTSQSAGSTVVDGNLIKMQIPSGGYYSSTSYLTTGKSTFGNAATTEVLDGKTFTSTAGLNTLGSMSNLGGTTRIVTPTFGDGSVLLGIPTSGYYNTSSILAAEGSDFGDASANDVLSGKTFTSSNGLALTGNIPVKTLSSSAQSVSINKNSTGVYANFPYGYWPQNGSTGNAYIYLPEAQIGSATAAQVLENATFTSSAGAKVEGTIKHLKNRAIYRWTPNENSNVTLLGSTVSYTATLWDRWDTTNNIAASHGKYIAIAVGSDNVGYLSEGNLYIARPGSDFGTAQVGQVKAGVTFTSENGVKVTGTYTPAVAIAYLSPSTSLNISAYDYVVIHQAGWGTDNGGYGSYTTTVTYGSNTWTKTISHGNACNRSTCGGLNQLVIDNRSKAYTTISVTTGASGSDIWGDCKIVAFKIA